MGDLFWNKVFAAVLTTALVIFGVKELSHALIHPHEPAEPGYKIAVAEESSGDEGAVEIVEEVSLAQMLSEASASAGERVAKKCTACHSFDKGGANKIGPNLWNILGRAAASHDSFGYSDAMQSFGGTWDYETLSAFLASPKAVVPKTAMSFAGLKKAKDSANILVYLRSLSDTPLALPALPVTEIMEDAEAVVETAGDEAESLAEALGADEATEPAEDHGPE